MPDVFISYARANEAVAKRVANALGSSGLDVWWDDQLPAHRAYSEVIEQRLRESKAVVVLWSKEAAQSQWVRAEADYARTQGKLVQAQLDGTLPPMPFNQIQCADLKGWRGKATHVGFAKLLASVRALVTGEDARAGPEPARLRWWQERRTQAAAAAALLFLVLAAFLFSRFLGSDDSDRPIVAVLPFESLDERDSSLVAGIWEDTRQALSRNPQLLVLGPNTSEQLAEDPKTASRAADYLVEASVRSVGDRVRVSANLVRTDDGAQMWSESFERRLDDVFELQQQVAGEIEGRIRGRLAERGGTLPEHIVTTGETYALYSDARASIRNRRMDEYERAFEQLQEVVKRDPNFAPGWATLAVIKAFGFPGTSSKSTAEEDARRAIALAPNLAAGHAALGFALGRVGPVAKAALERALELDPNDIEAMNWLANAHKEDGNVEATRALYDRILEIEPLWWTAAFNKLNLLFETGDILAAEQDMARLERLGAKRLVAAAKTSIEARKGDLSSAVDAGIAFYRTASPTDREFIANFLVPPLYQLGLLEIADEMAPPPSHFVPLIRKNDPRVFDVFEKEMEPQRFWTFGFLPIVGPRVYLLNNEGPRLARLYRAVAKSPREFQELVGKQAMPVTAPTVALALRAAGDEREAQALLELAEAAAPKPGRNLELTVNLARIYAAQGRKAEAMALLSAAVRRGWIPPFLPIHTDIALDPPLAELKGDPRFEQIRQQILGHLAKERAELGPVSLDPPAAPAATGSR